MTQFYIVRGLNQAGEEYFYTGRAGERWLSKDRSEAFGGYSLQGARNKATNFNKMIAIHGYHFIAVEA